jgi:hypothetical protein
MNEPLRTAVSVTILDSRTELIRVFILGTANHEAAELAVGTCGITPDGEPTTSLFEGPELAGLRVREVKELGT